MYKYYIRIFNILLIIVLLLSNIAYAGVSEKPASQHVTRKEEPASTILTAENRVNDDIVVGLLKTEEETYPHELGLSQNVYEMFNNFRVKIVLIDYNKIISLKKIQTESLNLAKQDETLAKKLTLDRIKVEVAQFIKEHKINRIFIPGNYYNLHSEPFPTTPCRQLVTEAIVKAIDDNPAIHLLGICGGLQGIMNAKGIEVVSVANLVSDEEKQRSHLKSSPNPQKEDVPLQQIKIIPNSRLAELVAKFLIPNENGWFSTYFPDAHSGAVSNTPENRRKLELLGYKVAAFSSDGVIEAIEDKHGNIYFQSHPEALVVKSDKNLYLSNHKERQVSTLVAIAIINDFLYRA
ncbi:gamma-glutamyl-gamma-aminobutyrate hydrolase family protein [Wolbachia endosymbiont of Drosophila tsacasi]|uniref:gamma-glutamyl-gamma-aminobutyrate hydrolase family protein n=1 Tax=Wolbachia endosymbiont of Drosophila tsacasi TaxID=3002579 RepID=UPI0023A9C119|nr:gamma-glutamyl-gamma-aminobutyrate hydrolase family protein [Wolbachia endosymbiont of Drosophila tsacasi]MDE5062074.1 gamma-glutamyl-gamma-aminobutyrate hydrolase family protein [Wolbachia endosymbiont of Drosophila tsacasi]